MVETVEHVDAYVARFERFESEGAKGRYPWLLPIRKAAMARFAELGFPTTRHEEWRFTNIAPVAGGTFNQAGQQALAVNPKILESVRISEDESGLVFVNGRLAKGVSDELTLPSGVRVLSLAAAMDRESNLLEGHLARHANYQENALAALNTALMEDGAVVIVPKGKAATTPVHLVFVSDAAQGPIALHGRVLVIADESSQVDVVETHVGQDGHSYFNNPVTEVFAGENAVARHYKIIRESDEAYHLATTTLHQKRNSVVNSYTLTLGGRIVRNDIESQLDGEGADSHIDGLYLTDGEQLVDNHLRVDHLKPHASSREFFKGVLSGRSRGVFSGRIFVAQVAQKTDAKQSNMSLLLSDEAQVDSKPQLEIFADDVKCTHGATIGQVDRDAVFYLRSRGISERDAVSILVHAFARESLEHIPLGVLRQKLEGLLTERLPHTALVKEDV
ncbi:MAG: Fe-S cluster assembly protein SufD [Phycisphaerae bacterium]|nr:Fe-S cluster assembly protein SufD [Phycisphaerae bacterium]